jgi:uncharacterized protein YndB with AHSA1/START domain
METKKINQAVVTVDFQDGNIVATVELAAPAQRTFQALASKEVTRWWVRPGVFDTREWNGEVRPGGRWEARGVAAGQPYVLEGEFVESQEPRKLVHTWHLIGTPDTTTVTYTLEDRGTTTRLSLEHGSFPSREACANTTAGWETSFEHLANYLSDRRGNGEEKDGR